MQYILNSTHLFFARFKRLGHIWLNRKELNNRLVLGLIFLGAICGILTYATLTNVPPFGNSSSGLVVMLNIDLIILLALVILVCRRLITVWMSRKRGAIGSNLHIRLVFIFSLLAAVPAVIMAIFSVGFFYFGLHGWLDQRVSTAINESQAVAEAYLSEHQRLIQADVFAMASDLDRQAELLSVDQEAMAKMLRTQSMLRNFSNVVLFDNQGAEIAVANEEEDFNYAAIPANAIRGIEDGRIRLLEGDPDSIRALLKLANYQNTYVFAERTVDPKVLGHVERARKGVAQYQELQAYSTRLQILLTSIYVVITLLLTISAVWFGLSFARRLMGPITALIATSEDVRKGDLSARVDTSEAMDEFKTLGRAFNRMTQQIESQQSELLTANMQMDFRRRFTETILGGVSTGIISVDNEYRITLANNACGELLQEDISALLGQKISYIMPELVLFLEDAFSENDFGAVSTCEFSIRRKDLSIRTFMARIVIERMDQNEKGAIITFDDLTNVLAAQRKAAWADIARRIAHEIKNPLTPIQLSAERLNRKYAKSMDEEDQAVFNQYTNTIIKHVNDIKTMVNAFSSFAKMPDPIMRNNDIVPLLHDVFTLHRNAHDRIAFHEHFETGDLNKIALPHDEQQIRQVLTNLLKNAIEAMEEKSASGNHKSVHMVVFPNTEEKRLYIGICDNGPGLPHNDIARLTEPYVTHKPKGTGLGLAIVKKILEDHQGELLFYPDLPIIDHIRTSNALNGASVFFTLPMGATTNNDT